MKGAFGIPGGGGGDFERKDQCGAETNFVSKFGFEFLSWIYLNSIFYILLFMYGLFIHG